MFNMGISGLGRNGFMNMVAQSQVDADAVINKFEEYIKLGYCSSVALASTYEDLGITEANLTEFDKNRIKRKVEENMAGGWR